jgi:ATP-dependent protease ClpP protease subunit
MTTPAPVTVYSRAVPTPSIIDMHISGQITAPENYLQELQVIREALEGDVINIYLNTEGGRVATAVQLVNAMRNSSAKIVAHLEGECHSAGTYIFLSADEWIVNHDCIMLIHNYSGGAGGKGGEILQHAEANNRWITKLMRNVYKDFLTTEEIDAVIKNQDIWLDSDEILARLEGVLISREKLAEEHDAATREEVLKQVLALTEEDNEDAE